MSDEGLPRGGPRPGDPGLGTADLWLVHVADLPGEVAMVRSWLSVAERARADRFHAPADQQRFAATRGALRGILGVAVEAPPESLAIELDSRGKPFLAGAHRGAGVQFSVSHSGDYALIGVVREHRIGVDIEHMHRASDITAIAERFLAPEETNAIRAREGREAVDTFFRIWTRKEACAKGVGDGLGLDFAGFSVNWVGDAGTCEVQEQAPARRTCWAVRSLSTVAGYAAAVALDSAEVVPQISQLAVLEIPH